LGDEENWRKLEKIGENWKIGRLENSRELGKLEGWEGWEGWKVGKLKG
jgi:hypothetical protein